VSNLKEKAKEQQSVYCCPECGEPLENVTATESHQNGTYEVRVKGSHVH
jgi:transcription initiation factor IIE alpha subunit